MTLSRNLVLALTVTAGAVFAAVLASRRRVRQREAARHETDLQRWDDECGVPAPAAVVTPPARDARN